MSLVKRLPPATRFKYAAIRLKSLINRFPTNVISTDLILLTLYDVAKYIWITVDTVPPIEEIKSLEETCDWLEECLKHHEKPKKTEEKPDE